MVMSLNLFLPIKKAQRRIGRGIGSGRGKTSGRGHKGQRARSSNIGAFEGGQIPIYRELPKRGFKRGFVNVNVSRYAIINLRDIQKLLAAGRISHGEVIDLGLCKGLGLIPRRAQMLKILGFGTLAAKLSFRVHAVSKAAREYISMSGSKLVII